MNKGASGEAYDRIKIARVIRDLYLTDWGSRLFMFENFNGTPLQTLLSLTMKRAEFTGSGPFAEFARNVVGIEAKHDQMTEYKTVADYAKAQDSARSRTESPPSRPPNNRTLQRNHHGQATHQLRTARQDDAEDAAGDGALPARRHAASGKLGRARAR